MDADNRRGLQEIFLRMRFMDDICIVYARNDNKSHASRFVTLTDLGASESRNSETRNAGCYQKPLKLEAGKDGTFLETRFWIEGDQIRFRLKNDNEGHDQKVWRYQHFDSNTPFLQKRATLTACLRKVQHQSSDKAAMGYSALEKIAEFRRLRYPTSILSKACTFLAASTGEGAWITIRNALR